MARAKVDKGVAVTLLVIALIGAGLIGSQLGWQVGLGCFLLAGYSRVTNLRATSNLYKEFKIAS